MGTRTLAWAAIAAQPLFVAGLPVLGEPAFVVLGLSFLALAAALRAVLAPRPAAAVAVALFAAVGLTHLLGAALRPEGEVNGIAVAASVMLVLTPYALSRALWPSPAAAAALAAGNAGFWLGVAVWVGVLAGDADGFRAAGFALVHLWAVVVAAGVLHATRPAPRPGPLIPLRPRDFLAREWEGEGELVLRPLFLGRFFAQRLRARRHAVWVSDRVWRFDDEARFASGHVRRRQNWCEFVGDDHVRVTAGDLPDGADVWIEDDGFRVGSFRFAFPLGPVPVIGECRDRSYLERDGTLVSQLDAYAPGLPIPFARLTFRVRPA